ncbi:ATP-dependent nuclease [Hyalangium rubrum]|uniref:AAA family ATPase n=1 Tax=Hyalangium rubrum TaxID=3103134 RepID=A0ABU5GX27_9BACT|nr:AAA family ATPase [Hyalangium sp. s54d21]MDY7225739.1 AAA family ATPase [Hyalangium sp. s54d21]
MLTRLELSNYRGFRSLQLELAPLTVIIGRNGYGKSTLLEASLFLMAALDDSRRRGGTYATPSSAEASPGVLESAVPNVQAILTREGPSIAPEFSVAADFDRATLGHVRLLARPSANGSLTVHLDSGPVPDSPPASMQGASAALIQHVSRILIDEPIRSEAEVEGLSRSGLQSDILRNRLHRLGDAGLERINRTLRALANAEIVRPPALGEATPFLPLAVHFRRDGSTHELGAGNHALISMVSLLVEMETFLSRPSATGEKLLLLDEPELHLHPRNQRALAAHLSDRAREKGAQIVFVTHSVDIASEVSWRADTAVLTFERPFSKPRRLDSQHELLRALSDTHDLMQFASINFLGSRRVLFCEGKSDKAILQRCALAHFHSAPARHGRFERWMIIPLQGVANTPTTQLVERLVSSSLLPTLGPSEALVVVDVKDRDYERQPGRSMHTGNQVERVEQVWHRHSIESLFIDVPVLSSIFRALLGDATPSDLEGLIRDAITAADRDVTLNEATEDEFAEVYRRTRKYYGKAAQQEARQAVRANPEIWQRGKDRANFVLRHIGSHLPTKQHNIGANVSKLLDAIPRESFQKIVLPVEIVEFLDFLADRA